MSKKIVIKVEMGNDAFSPSECFETARILRELADKMEQQQNFNADDYFMLLDQNGNTVGGADIKM